MTIHYHGTPITPKSVLDTLGGRHFCVSHADPRDVKYVHQIGQSVMLDNGAFSAWTSGRAVDWTGYYSWAEEWLAYRTTWAVIPDVIDGDEDANDALLDQWPHGDRGAPVWHLHESLDRLERLCGRYSRVCLGSSGEYRMVGSSAWHRRMTQAMNLICGDGPAPVWLHMLRGMALSGSHYPLASVDSTDIARHHHEPNKNAAAMAARWDAQQCAAVWHCRPIDQFLF